MIKIIMVRVEILMRHVCGGPEKIDRVYEKKQSQQKLYIFIDCSYFILHYIMQ